MSKDITIFILATICFSSIIVYVILYNKIKSLARNLGKLYVDNAVMQEYIDILQSKESSYIPDELVDKENFIKFLSDSRDWAYKYIEDVQFGIKEFIDSVQPDLLYFDEYGEVGSAYPHYEAMVRINNAYKQLKTLMPKEEEVE
jgi:hypothetical protein